MSAIGHGQFHGLGNDVIGCGRIALFECPEVNVLEDVQYLCNVNAAGTGWGKTDDLVTSIGRSNRFPAACSIAEKRSDNQTWHAPIAASPEMARVGSMRGSSPNGSAAGWLPTVASSPSTIFAAIEQVVHQQRNHGVLRDRSDVIAFRYHNLA